MHATDDREIQVGPVTPDQLMLAMELLYAHLPERARRRQIAQTRRDFERNRVDPGGLLGARRERRLVGVLLVVEQPGGTAMLWPPSICQSGAEGDRVANALLQSAATRFAERGCRHLQALLDPSDRTGAQCLTRNRFVPVAELLYLERGLSDVPSSGATALRLASYSREGHAQFEEVVERTYEGSLDAPQLNGTRPTNEVLAGHQAVGAFDPGRWLLAYEANSPVGCLLMSDHAELAAWEIVYLGVVPSARGRGLGRELTLEALRRAQAHGARRVLVAVDQNNHPACKVYADLGFRPSDRRIAFLRFIADEAADLN
jgi:ribosomal protein S18 acetylase RimI-like enzyme